MCVNSNDNGGKGSKTRGQLREGEEVFILKPAKRPYFLKSMKAACNDMILTLTDRKRACNQIPWSEIKKFGFFYGTPLIGIQCKI